MTPYKLLRTMIDTYKVHLETVDDDKWWGSDFEISLQNQINYLFEHMDLKTEEQIQDVLYKATLDEMVEYWEEWLEEKKWDLNEEDVKSIDVFG